MRRIFLDSNSTTKPLPEVIEAMERCWRDAWANPGSRHAEGRAARRSLETARESIAAILGAHPEEVIFTSGGTEAIHTAVRGLTPPLASPDDARIIATTAGEHPATREACRAKEAAGFLPLALSLTTDGLLDESQFHRLPWSDIRLVSVILAHNETGVIQPTASLAEWCARHGVPWHLDAVQAVGKIPVDFRQLGATALSLGAHKFHGPRGVGALLVRKGVPLAPLLRGGHQEAERRAGTEPVPIIVGMAKALELWRQDQQKRTVHLATLRDKLQTGLQGACGSTIVHGERADRLPNTLNIAFPGIDGEALLVALDLEGVSCSLGSTCASGAAEPAPVLLAMGCPKDVALSSVRFSVGLENTLTEIDDVVLRVARTVERLRSL